MKVLKKIGSFFAAMVPVFVLFSVQSIVVILGASLAYAVEMKNTMAFPEVISDNSAQLVSIIANLICVPVALVEMRIHRFEFKDISPVKQNKRVYLFSVLFALGAFFVFWFVSSTFMRITGVENMFAAHRITDESMVLMFLAFMIEPIVEELFFRGMLYKNYEKSFSIRFGAAVTTLMYALYYIDLSYAFLTGAALMFIRYKFGDLKLCFFVNMIMTAMYVAVSLMNSEHYEQVIAIGAAVGVVAAAAGMLFMIRSASKAENSVSE